MKTTCLVTKKDNETWIIKLHIKFNPFVLLRTDGKIKTFSTEQEAIKHAHLLGFTETNMTVV